MLKGLSDISYYDLVTDMYEEAWGQSFHFCRFAIGEPFLQALARHEHYLAHMIDLRPEMLVLDVGCGVGGPAREMAKFTGCEVVGLNNNGYQLQRAVAHTRREGLEDKVSFVKGDFMVRLSSLVSQKRGGSIVLYISRAQVSGLCFHMTPPEVTVFDCLAESRLPRLFIRRYLRHRGDCACSLASGRL